MERYFKESIDLQNAILRDAEMLAALRESVGIVTECLRRGNKLLIAGNGTRLFVPVVID